MVGRRRSTGTQQSPTRSGMHGTRATGALTGAGHTGTSRSRRSRGLAGTRRTLVKRLARARRCRPERHSGTRRGGAGHSRPWTHMSGLRRTRLMPEACRKIGARGNYGPGGRLTDDRRCSRAARLRASRMLSKWLPGCRARMTGRGWPGLAGTGCRTRRWSDRHARTYALRSRWRGRWRGGPRRRSGDRLLRRQRLPRTRKDLTRPGRRRWNRPGWRWHRAQRSGWRRQRKAWRCGMRRRMCTRRSCTRSYRRMNRRAASQHWRTQRNGARLIIVRVGFLFGSFWRGHSGRCRLAFMSFSERGG